MTVAKNADVANVQEALVAELVQRELQAASKMSGLFDDYSSLVGKGTSEVKIPRADSFSVLDRDNATPTEGTSQNLTFAFDSIPLNKNKYVSYVIPGSVEEDAKPSYEMTAAQRSSSAHGRDMDIQRIDALWSTVSNQREVEYDAGVSDIEQVLLDMIEQADEAEMLDDGGRFLIVRPSERKALLSVANFVQADKYGNNTALISGELGALYGIRVIMINHVGTVADANTITFGNGNMILCHRESLGFAFKQRPATESQQAIEYGVGSKKHTWDVYYGLGLLNDGKLIVKAGNFTV